MGCGGHLLFVHLSDTHGSSWGRELYNYRLVYYTNIKTNLQFYSSSDGATTPSSCKEIKHLATVVTFYFKWIRFQTNVVYWDIKCHLFP